MKELSLPTDQLMNELMGQVALLQQHTTSGLSQIQNEREQLTIGLS